MLDHDLAEVYGVSTARLNEQVKRNGKRFPADFMFQLTPLEVKNLMSQNATSSWGGRRKPPFAFTEYGAVMAANVLNSVVAVRASVYIVRAFIRLRESIVAHRDMAAKIAALERKYDKNFQVVFQALRELMEPPAKTAVRIGFRG
jgi:hypothetical protein